jgi:hypothetical protein
MVYGKLEPLEKARKTSVALWYYFYANCFLEIIIMLLVRMVASSNNYVVGATGLS